MQGPSLCLFIELSVKINRKLGWRNTAVFKSDWLKPQSSLSNPWRFQWIFSQFVGVRGANTLRIWTWDLESMCSVSSSCFVPLSVRCCSFKRIGILGGSFSLCCLISIFPLVNPYFSLWLLSFVTLMLVQSQLLLVLQEIKVQGLGAVSELDQTAKGGKAALHWKAAAWGFTGSIEMAVFSQWLGAGEQ